jgi:hypothetical protein
MTERSEVIIRLSPLGHGAASRSDVRTARPGTEMSEVAA